MNWLLVISYMVLSVAGQILFKYGANKKFLFSYTNGNLNISISWISIVGAMCYVASFLLFLLLLSKYDLSRINPILVGLTYILALTGAVIILHESINAVQILGIILILVGVLLVMKGNII